MAKNPTAAKWNNKTEKIMDRPEIKNELNSSILLSDSGTIMSDPATANHAGQTTPISTPSCEKPNADGKSNAAPKPTYFVFWLSSPAKWPIFSHSVSCSILLFFLATKSLPILQSVFEPVISTLASSMLRAAFIFTGVLSLLHQTGALRRYALHFAENELSKIMNGTLVTLSDIEVDIWRGRVIARDLIIHNKDRAEWDWESPCLARVGRIEATVNFASLIEVPHYGQILNHTFKDVYTALVEDVQVFIEKRRNIFNFHLLDPTLDIPDASLVMEAYWERKWGRTRSLTLDDAQSDDDNSVRLSKSMSLDHGDYRPDSSLAKSDKISLGRTSKEDSGPKVEANRIVERLVGGLTDLGKATSESGTKGLQSVLRNQRQSWIENLKRLHSINSSTDMPNIDEKDGKDRSEPLTKKTPLKLITKDKVAEGIDVMRQLGKVVEKNVAGIKENMEYLQKPPPKKAGLESKPPNDMIRIGSFLLREMRIFTKDVLGQGQNAIAYPISNVSTIDSASISTMTGNETATKEAKDLLPSGWSPPIVVWELAITGAEFSPPMSARDSHSGLPVVGIPVERAVDIIVKRLLTETAKSNSGRLFQTAFGDVFSFVEVPRRKQSSAKASEK